MKTVGEIKKYAESLPMLDGRALAGELVRLKNGGVPFLGCVCFVQHNRKGACLRRGIFCWRRMCIPNGKNRISKRCCRQCLPK